MSVGYQKYSITKKFQATPEYKEFELWCENNHKYPMKLLKKYCRYTTLLDKDLTEIRLIE